MFGRFSLLSAAICGVVTFVVPSWATSPTVPVTGAIFTTVVDGSVVNANLYINPTDVYLIGGPEKNGSALRPGTYYYQVTDPNGDVVLSTDPAVCRQLTVGASGLVTGIVTPAGCTAHGTGLNPITGAVTVQLAPFSPTPNQGGEYKAWLISQEQGKDLDVVGCGSATVNPDTTNPAVLNFPPPCAKTDNFKLRNQPCDPSSPTCQAGFTLSGLKFYDRNDNTKYDAGESGIAGFKISITINGGSPAIAYTLGDGSWTYGGLLANDTYLVCEVLPVANSDGTYWFQTSPVFAASTGQCHSGQVTTADVTGLNFGNLCLRAPGGAVTRGFWANKNGSTVLFKDGSLFGSGGFLNNLNLRTANGSYASFTGYNDFKTWLGNANAVNMAYMLSAQLATTELDVREGALGTLVPGFVSSPLLGTTLILTPDLGVQSIDTLMGWAVSSLGTSPLTNKLNKDRAYQQDLEATLDGINNNQLPFVSPSACTVTY